MDTFIFDFNTDSTLTNDTNSTHSDLDWTAFQSAPPPTTNSPFSPLWSSQQDDAVAPNNRSTLVATPHDDEIYFEMEHFFNGLNQQEQLPPIQPQQQQQHHQGIIEPIHVNINVPDQIESPSRTHLSLVINEQPMSCLSTPMVPRVSSARSQCYHKLPDHAVKLMQEWYNANLDDPYPRSPDKKRFITEGNITAQQCRSWFANRRQRLKHVKRNQSKSSLSVASSSSRVHHSIQTRLSQLPPAEAQMLAHEHCYYCQQQQQQQQQQQITLSPSPIPLSIPTNPTTATTTTTTLNVVINQQTVEQLIHNSLRKLLYPALM
ncbi:unnamed protein product [Adineta ricciae]|uniref:Homeobox domain-containing protein n=1 Tax=Adineta ricciae TaxID=249248 RepID=A0A814APC4_ADIRI|nr:unnamed protein product [Adineta ricciae]